MAELALDITPSIPELKRQSESFHSDSVSHCVERLKEISSTCYAKSEQHRKWSIDAHRRHTYISIPSLFVAAITTSVAYVPVGTKPSPDKDAWLPIFIAGIATINSILLGMITFFKWDQLSIRHTSSSKTYILLANEIKDYLVRMPRDSDTWFTDLRQFTKQYQEIVMNSPLH